MTGFATALAWALLVGCWIAVCSIPVLWLTGHQVTGTLLGRLAVTAGLLTMLLAEVVAAVVAA